VKHKITVALAGNPNAGKTTIFNNLTGSHQHVGNYPGVTVEKKVGKAVYKDTEFTIIDLPGTYSLTAFSAEEMVARAVLIEENIDVVVNVVDASNLERNLNLTAQLKELGLPLIVALNMVDIASSQGISFNYGLLSQLLAVQVIPVTGTKNKGTTELLDAIIDVANNGCSLTAKPVRYEEYIEKQINFLERILPEALYKDFSRSVFLRRWFAIKLLEYDQDILSKLKEQPTYDSVIEQVNICRYLLLQKYKQDPEMLIVEGRYAFIRGACREALSYTPKEQATVTDRIDAIVLNRLLGLPIFLVIMWLLFQMTFTLGNPPMSLIESGFARFADLLNTLMPAGLLKSLIIDGIIGGVGGVIVFLPNILFLFLGISLLEASGYMARAAFVTDRLMHRIGLHGKSFIPMILGFGCSIPAIMATRTLENKRDRFVTMLIVPLMSCGARLPVYTLLTAAFFEKQTAGNILFSVYLVGVLLALIMAKVLRTWILPGESEPFVMELPVYRLPTVKNILMQMWIRAWLYLKKAGTVILAASVITWILFTFPLSGHDLQSYPNTSTQLEQSYAGQLGHLIEPVIRPLGFDWKTGIALVAGFAGKEIVVSTLGTLYSIEDTGSGEINAQESGFAERVREQSGYTPLVAYVLMLFVLIYVPCLATVAIIRHETNNWKWPLFLIGYTLALAWLVSFVVYRAGLLYGLGS